MSFFGSVLGIDEAVAAENLKRKVSGDSPISDNQKAILKKMGFTNGDQAKYFNAEIEANPQLKKVFDSYETAFATDPKYAGLLKEVGTQVLKEGERVGFDVGRAKSGRSGVLDKLSSDIGKGGPDAANFQATLTNNPAFFDGKIAKYASGETAFAQLGVRPLKQDLGAADSGGKPPRGDASPPPPPRPSAPETTGGLVVHQRQAYLEVLGFNPGKLDGVSGPKTNTALAAFAEKNGLDKNDIAGIDKKLAEQMHNSKEAKTYLAMVKQEIESGKYTKDHVEAAQWAMKEQGADMSHSLKRGKMDGIPGKGTRQDLDTVLARLDSAKPEPMQTTAALGTSGSPPQQAAPQQTVAADQNAGSGQSAVVSADPHQAILQKITKASDEDIRTKWDNSDTLEIIGGIRDYANKNFPELKNQNYPDAFYSSIAGNPQLQDKITNNLKNNPDFVRNIAKLASEDGGAALANESFRRTVQGQLKSLFQDPTGKFIDATELADDKYVKDMNKNLVMAQNMKDGGNALGGMGDWFKNNLGMDMGGMMGGIGAFFQQIMSFVQNFIGQITGGNFISMRNSGMDLFGAFKESMNQASMGVENSVREKGYLQVVGLKERADGFMKDKDGNVLSDPKTGKPIEKIVPNTIEVTSINDMKHQVYATTGLNSTRNPPDTKGNVTYNVRVATGLDESGNVSSYTSMVLSKEEYKKYIEEVEKRKPGSMKYDQNYAEVMGVGKQTNVVSVDPKTGATTEQVAAAQPQPAAQANMPGTNIPERDRMGFKPNELSYFDA